MLAVEHEYLDVLAGEVQGHQLGQRSLGLADNRREIADSDVDFCSTVTCVPTGSAV